MDFLYKKYKLLHILLGCLMLSISSVSTTAQVTFGSTDAPDQDAILDLKELSDGSSKKGLLLPRVALVSENDPSPMSEHVEGMYVYNTATKNDITPGNYFNDGVKWNKVKKPQNEPWFESVNRRPASHVDEDIYHTAAVGMNTSSVHPSALAEVFSNSKGMLIPRLSKEERDNIQNPATGLLVYNITSSCLNYYNGALSKWVSLCGKQDPAVIDLLNCDVPPTGPKGIYTVKDPLKASNTYTINVNVTNIGPYDIIGNTTNGYSFVQSGKFNALGPYQITLDGRGIPAKEGLDDLTLYFNANKVTPDCKLPPIPVKPAGATFTVTNCDNIIVSGTYTKGVPMNGLNQLIVILNVTKAGPLKLETLKDNGIWFVSEQEYCEVGEKRIALIGRGTPIANGTFTGNKIDVEGIDCAPRIRVGKGTFNNPANSCQEILEDDLLAEDGYYWVGAKSGTPYKTYCDMEPDGAWTLVKSLSEYQILVVEKSQNESIGTQKARNVVTDEFGIFNEYAFSLPSATVNEIGIYNNGTDAPKRFRFAIKERGHSTQMYATIADVENSTVSPNDDIWTQDNYWNVTIKKGNPATGNYSGGANDMSEGKLFGKSFGKPTYTSNKDYQYDGVTYPSPAPPGMTSTARFFTGFYGHVALGAGKGAVNYFYKDEDGDLTGKYFTFGRNDINDLFGLYMGSERQLNHHIGTCANSDDDYGGDGNCKAGWTNWRPHKFNFSFKRGVYEGRIVQYWVK